MDGIGLSHSLFSLDLYERMCTSCNTHLITITRLILDFMAIDIFTVLDLASQLSRVFIYAATVIKQFHTFCLCFSCFIKLIIPHGHFKLAYTMVKPSVFVTFLIENVVIWLIYITILLFFIYPHEKSSGKVNLCKPS